MEANKILKADLLDILFENRNKGYGAYDLRKNYNRRIIKSLVIAMVLIGSAFATMLMVQPSSKVADEVEVRDVVVQNIEEIKPPPPPPPPPPAEEPPPPPEKAPPTSSPPVPKQMETTKFTPPVIKKDNEVKQEDIPPVRDVAKVDVVTTEGIKDEGIVTNNLPPVSTNTVDKGTGVVEAPKKIEDENKIFEKVEIEASVNMAQWRRHLETKLQRYIEDAASSGMSPGKYTVNVRFLVEKDGSISDVKALNDPGYGLGRGAVAVVKSGPNWRPGEQNGRKVRSYHTQPITFVISDGFM